MKKLTALRNAILASPLEIKAKDLLTWTENGTVEVRRGGDNHAFEVSYTVHVVVTNFVRQPHDLLFIALDWLREHEAGAGADAFKFGVDVNDEKSCDVELEIQLSEVIAAHQGPDGVLDLEAVPDPDVQKFDMSNFRAELGQPG